MSNFFSRKLSLLGAAVALLSTTAHADTVLETETAQIGRHNEWLISNSLQFEKSPEGRARFTLFQYEYGLSDRAELLIEPFFREWVAPKDGEKFSGTGDLEITPSYLLYGETESAPAVLMALKVKVPTAKNRDIGTGKVDYFPYVIFGKHIGDWTLNANLGVDFIGRVPGLNLRDQGIFAFSAERKINDKLSIFGEVFGNTSAVKGESGTSAVALAFEYQLTDHFNYFVSAGYDSDDVFNIRPGFNVFF